MASDNLDPNLPDDGDYADDMPDPRGVAVPSPETVEQYKQRKAGLSAREKRINKVAKRVGLVARLVFLAWVGTFVGAALTIVGIGYVVLHFIAKHW